MPAHSTLPGFREFYPEDFAWRRHLFQVWRQTARRFAFREFDGPALEPLELFTAKSGEEIVGQLFSFRDKGGREVALRPELTPTLARMVAAKASALKRPIKWFSVGDNYRYEKPQRGRLRCFGQLNADVLGESGPAAEVELIALAIQTLAAFGLGPKDVAVRLSDREVWTLFLEAAGCPEEAAFEALGLIDKWERLGEREREARLEALGPSAASAASEAVARFSGVDSLAGIRAAFESVRLSEAGAARLESRLAAWRELLGGLEAMGLGAYLQIDLGVVRGLAYYTGFVFEAFDRSRSLRALAGGGRYDGLVEKLGGPPMPAAGFGMGDVVLTELLEERGLRPPLVDAPDIYAVIGGEEERMEALEDVAFLRQAGYSVDYPLKPASFGKQFKAASASGARLAIVYGSAELADETVTLRDLRERAERQAPRETLLEAVREAMER